MFHYPGIATLACVVLSFGEGRNDIDATGDILVFIVDLRVEKLVDSQGKGVLCSPHKRPLRANMPLSMIKIGNPKQEKGKRKGGSSEVQV
jgi:hypothetical protein